MLFLKKRNAEIDLNQTEISLLHQEQILQNINKKKWFLFQHSDHSRKPFKMSTGYSQSILAKRRAKTRRGKRYLENKEPKVYENPKATMFVRGPGQDAQTTACMKDLVTRRTNALEWHFETNRIGVCRHK